MNEGVGPQEYSIDFYYADYPSIEGTWVTMLIDQLTDFIKEVDNETK